MFSKYIENHSNFYRIGKKGSGLFSKAIYIHKIYS